MNASNLAFTPLHDSKKEEASLVPLPYPALKPTKRIDTVLTQKGIAAF